MAPDPAVPGAPPRARPRYPGAHLLQVRGRLAGRLAQAQQRGRPGLCEQGGRRRAAGDRDGRRAVGLRPCARLLAVRARVRGLHGRRQLRPEALPARDDGELGRDRDPLAQRHDRLGPRPGRASDRLAGDRDLRGGGGGRGRRRHQLRARLGAQPRVPAPDGDRPGGAGADGDGRRRARRGGRLRRRRVELRGDDVPLHPARAARRGAHALRGGGAGGVPDADPRRLPLRLRRHRRADAADADVHARARLRPAAGARRWAALPRRLADRLRPGQAGPGGGARLPARTRRSRRRCASRAPRRSCPRPSRRTRSGR